MVCFILLEQVFQCRQSNHRKHKGSVRLEKYERDVKEKLDYFYTQQHPKSEDKKHDTMVDDSIQFPSTENILKWSLGGSGVDGRPMWGVLGLWTILLTKAMAVGLLLLLSNVVFNTQRNTTNNKNLHALRPSIYVCVYACKCTGGLARDPDCSIASAWIFLFPLCCLCLVFVTVSIFGADYVLPLYAVEQPRFFLFRLS